MRRIIVACGGSLHFSRESKRSLLIILESFYAHVYLPNDEHTHKYFSPEFETKIPSFLFTKVTTNKIIT